uniref:Uncharacterized protein n=1 Tax=Glossina pallidipes TaxID=7398 RepID=A0A1B0AJJ0_GLOPL
MLRHRFTRHKKTNVLTDNKMLKIARMCVSCNLTPTRTAHVSGLSAIAATKHITQFSTTSESWTTITRHFSSIFGNEPLVINVHLCTAEMQQQQGIRTNSKYTDINLIKKLGY